jgi:hypothetical protein
MQSEKKSGIFIANWGGTRTELPLDESAGAVVGGEAQLTSASSMRFRAPPCGRCRRHSSAWSSRQAAPGDRDAREADRVTVLVGPATDTLPDDQADSRPIPCCFRSDRCRFSTGRLLAREFHRSGSYNFRNDSAPPTFVM